MEEITSGSQTYMDVNTCNVITVHPQAYQPMNNVFGEFQE